MAVTPEEIWKEQLFNKAPNHVSLSSVTNAWMKMAGDTMSRLEASPDWEFYGRFLETQLKGHTAMKQRFDEQLLNALLPGPAYAEAKVNQQYHKGWVDGLTHALTFAKTLIEQGQEEAKALTKQGEPE